MKKIGWIVVVLVLPVLLAAQNLQETELFNALEKMRWGGALQWDTLGAALKAENVKIRFAALQTLASGRNEQARDHFIGFLQNEDPAFRFQALKGLLLLRDQHEAAMVGESAADPDAGVRMAAECYLQGVPGPALAALGSGDLRLTLGAIDLLSCFDTPEVLAAQSNLLSHPMDEIRAQAAQSLRAVRSPEAGQRLLAGLRTETYYYVQVQMARSLAYGIADRKPLIRQAFLEPKVSKIIWEALGFEGRQKDFMDDFWGSLAGWPQGDVRFLSACLEVADSPAVRDEAAAKAADSRLPAPIRSSLMEFLANHPCPSALPVFRAFQDSGDPTIKGNALWGLGALKDRKSVAVLKREVRAADPYVRWCALWALGEILGSEAAPLAQGALQDPDPQVRQTAQDILENSKKGEAMNDPVYRLGHDAFLVRAGGKNVYFDPFQLPDGLPKAEVILITHDHYDHLSPDDIRKIATEKTELVLPRPFKDKGAGLPGRVNAVAAGESVVVGGVEVRAVPAYNPAKKFHPKAYGGLGYVVKIGGTTYYHAGDTDLLPEMKEFPPADVCFLPVSGTYVMTAGEAAEATKILRCKKAIPMHYGAIVGSDRDAVEFKKSAACPVEILPKVDRIP